MTTPRRYLRLMAAYARFGLANEMAFRANFLVKLTVEALWLSILLAFNTILYKYTKQIAGWNFEQYLFFIGCHYALSGLIETFFLENCTGFAELVRTGDLDFYLLRPIDEQFLLTTRHIDWSTFPNVLQGAGVMIYALWSMSWQFDPGLLLGFLVLFFCGCAMTYSFLLMLSSMSVWMVRNQSLMEMWWLFTSLMRYPREVFFATSWSRPVGWFFTFIIPVMLVINVPARTMVQVFEPGFVAMMVGATVVLLVVSRAFFRRALSAYRSASS